MYRGASQGPLIADFYEAGYLSQSEAGVQVFSAGLRSKPQPFSCLHPLPELVLQVHMGQWACFKEYWDLKHETKSSFVSVTFF